MLGTLNINSYNFHNIFVRHYPHFTYEKTEAQSNNLLKIIELISSRIRIMNMGK